MINEKQKPTNQKYRDNYDATFGSEKVYYVDEIIGTNAYIDGRLQPKREGYTYRELPKVRKGTGPVKPTQPHRDRTKYQRSDVPSAQRDKDWSL